MENNTYEIIIGAFVVISVLLGTTIIATDKIYYCEDREIYGFCFKLSNPNADDLQTRCYYNESAPTRYKNCGTGWEVFTQGEIEIKSYGSKEPMQELCSYSGCVPIK